MGEGDSPRGSDQWGDSEPDRDAGEQLDVASEVSVRGELTRPPSSSLPELTARSP